jgi:hypothetical protein
VKRFDEHAPGFVRDAHHALGFGSVGRKWFLTQHVFARTQRLDGPVLVQVHRQGL